MSDSLTAVTGNGQPAPQNVSLGKDAGPDGRAVLKTSCSAMKLHKKQTSPHARQDEGNEGACRKKPKIDRGLSVETSLTSSSRTHHRACNQRRKCGPNYHLLGSYTCPICLDSVKNAVATPCGHLMCGECLFEIFKTDALRMQERVRGQQRITVLCDMARGVPEAPVPETLSGSSTRSRILYFLSARQIASALESTVLSTCRQWLTRLIDDARAKPGHGVHRSWTKFLCSLLRVGIYTGGISGDTCAVQEVGFTLATASSTDLSALLSGTRDADGAVEQAIRDANDKLSTLVCNDGISPPSLPSLTTLPGLWSIFAASTPEYVQLSAQLQDASALIHALRHASTRLSLQEPVAHGHLPRLAPEASFLGAVLGFAQASNTVDVLTSAHVASSAVYFVLDRLSAYLWTLTDSGRSFDELFKAAHDQRVDAFRRRDPHAPSALRLTSDELDPLVGTACPVCRAGIPGGFFGQRQRQGLQGLKLQLGIPAVRRGPHRHHCATTSDASFTVTGQRPQ